MKSIILTGVCAATVLAACCSTPHKRADAEKVESTGEASVAKASGPEANTVDSAQLQGSWKGRSLRETPEHQCTFAISGKNFEFHDDTETNVWYSGTFSLKEDVTPRQFLAHITDSAFPQYVGKSGTAIYKIVGDTLTIAANEPGNAAVPESFDAPESACIELKKK